MQHGETVSPDRKAIYEDSMKKTGGKMNGACMFWDAKGSTSLDQIHSDLGMGNGSTIDITI